MSSPDKSTITVVSGLPRSGTSLMMSLLEAGGIPLMIDNIRQADEDNPRGYFEFEAVKKLKNDQSWLPFAQGRAIKIISTFLMRLPANYQYRIVFMRRTMQEILASQRQMLIHRGEAPDNISDAVMSATFEKHLTQLDGWLPQQPNMSVLYVDYAKLIESPQEWIHAINHFTGGHLNEQKMLVVVDPKLYRQRVLGSIRS